jgi:Icc-related predicted phosphoesterase
LKILHTSDTHGSFPDMIGDFDLIVHSGDLLVNQKPRMKLGEALFQRDWIRENGDKFKQWIGNKPFLFCAGNHDYMDPCSELRDLGINAIDTTNKLVEVDGVKFYGFPYVPYIGFWNWEAPNQMMRQKIREMVEIIEDNKIDVLIAHCPPYGILDKNTEGTNIGNVAMTNALIDLNHLPKAYLCGHCHNKQNIIHLPINNKYIRIVNSATICRIVEI